MSRCRPGQRARCAGRWHASSKSERRTARLIRLRHQQRREAGGRCRYCGWKPKRARDLRWLDVHHRNVRRYFGAVSFKAKQTYAACKWCHGRLSNGKRPDAAHSRAQRRKRRIP